METNFQFDMMFFKRDTLLSQDSQEMEKLQAQRYTDYTILRHYCSQVFTVKLKGLKLKNYLPGDDVIVLVVRVTVPSALVCSSITSVTITSSYVT